MVLIIYEIGGRNKKDFPIQRKKLVACLGWTIAPSLSFYINQERSIELAQ